MNQQKSFHGYFLCPSRLFVTFQLEAANCTHRNAFGGRYKTRWRHSDESLGCVLLTTCVLSSPLLSLFLSSSLSPSHWGSPRINSPPRLHSRLRISFSAPVPAALPIRDQLLRAGLSPSDPLPPCRPDEPQSEGGSARGSV